MNCNIPQTGVQGTPKKKAEPKYPKSDWSEGSYHDMMMKAADAKRKIYNNFCYESYRLHKRKQNL